MTSMVSPREWVTRLEARVREWRSAPLPPQSVATTSDKASAAASNTDIAALFREALVGAPCLEVATVYVAWQLESIDRSAAAATTASSTTRQAQTAKGAAAAVAAATELVHAKKTRVYEAALQHIGGDVHALPLWRSYLAHIGRSALGFARALGSSDGGGGGGDRSKTSSPEHSRKMEAAFARALATPLAAAHKLWDDYYAWHRAASDVRGPAVERDTRRQRARTIALGETRRRVYSATTTLTTPPPPASERTPPAPSASRGPSGVDTCDERVRVWRGWRAAIAFERARKYQVPRDDWRRAMRLVHRQAAAAAQTEYPDYWCDRLCWTVEFHATAAEHYAQQHARYLSLVHKFDTRRHFAFSSSSSSSSSSGGGGGGGDRRLDSDTTRLGRNSTRRRDDRRGADDDAADDEEEDDVDALRTGLGRKFEAHHDADDVHAYDSEFDDGVDTRLDDATEKGDDARVTPLNLHLHLARHARSPDLVRECVDLFREAWRSCLPSHRCDDFLRSAAAASSSRESRKSPTPARPSANCDDSHNLAKTLGVGGGGAAAVAADVESKNKNVVAPRRTSSPSSLSGSASGRECAGRRPALSPAAKNVLAWVCVQWSELDETLRVARGDDAPSLSGELEPELVASRLYRDAWRHTRRTALVAHQAWREWRTTGSLSHVLAAVAGTSTAVAQSDADSGGGDDDDDGGQRAPMVATSRSDGDRKHATQHHSNGGGGAAVAALVLLEIISHRRLVDDVSDDDDDGDDDRQTSRLTATATAAATAGERKGPMAARRRRSDDDDDRLYETTLRECSTAREQAQVMRRWCADLEARGRCAEILRLCVRHPTRFGAESRRIALRVALLTQPLATYRDTVQRLFASRRAAPDRADADESDGGDGGAITVRLSDRSTYAVARAFSATVAAWPDLYSRDYRRFLERALAGDDARSRETRIDGGLAAPHSYSSETGVVAPPHVPTRALSLVSADPRSNSLPATASLSSPPPRRNGEWTTYVAPVAALTRSPSESPSPSSSSSLSLQPIQQFRPSISRDFAGSLSPPPPLLSSQVARAHDTVHDARHSATTALGERDRERQPYGRERRQMRTFSPTDRREHSADDELGHRPDAERTVVVVVATKRDDPHARRRRDATDAERGRRRSDRDAGEIPPEPRRSDEKGLRRAPSPRSVSDVRDTEPGRPIFPTDLLRQRGAPTTTMTRDRSSGFAGTNASRATAVASAVPIGRAHSPNRKRKMAGEEDTSELRSTLAADGLGEIAATTTTTTTAVAAAKRARHDAPPAAASDARRRVDDDEVQNAARSAPSVPAAVVPKKPLRSILKRGAAPPPSEPIASLASTVVATPSLVVVVAAAAAAATMTMTTTTTDLPKLVATPDARLPAGGGPCGDSLPLPSPPPTMTPPPPSTSVEERRRSIPRRQPPKRARAAATAKPQTATGVSARPTRPLVPATTDAVASRRERTDGRRAQSCANGEKVRIEAKKSPVRKTTSRAASVRSTFLPPPLPPPLSTPSQR